MSGFGYPTSLAIHSLKRLYTVRFYTQTFGPSNLHIVARTPSKLTSLMLSCSIPQSTLDERLHIIQGDVKDIAAVLATLTPPFLSTLSPGSPVVNIILSGIGTPPRLSTKLDFTVCESAANSMIFALRSLSYTPDQAPYITTISTTGITNGTRDVPLLLVPLYHVVLGPPHKDKKAAEVALDSVKDEGIFSGITTLRPTLLSDGKETTGQVKAGTEKKPVLGYTISRKDVGKWMYEEMIAGDGKSKWKGEKVTLCY